MSIENTFPKEWERRRLGDVVDNFDRKRKPLSGGQRERIKGEYPYCGANGIVDHINGYLFDGEYVLLAEDGGYWGALENSSYLMAGQFWVNNHAHILRAKDGIAINQFVMYLLNFMNINPFIGGDSRGKLTQAIMNALPVALPTLTEQKQIARVLGQIESAIKMQDNLIRVTTELKKALMQKLFTEGLYGEKQKQTEIGPMPESWEVVQMEAVISEPMLNGAFIKKPKYGSGLPFVNVVDIYESAFIDFRALERIDIAEQSVKKHLLKENDIVFVRSSLKREGIGQSCLIRGLTEPAFYDCHLIKIAPDVSKVLPEYLVYFWRSDVGKRELIQRSKTTTMTTINQTNLSEARMPLPSVKEQKEIANIFSTFDKKIRASERKKRTYQTLFKALLSQLMTGQIRVKDLSPKTQSEAVTA